MCTTSDIGLQLRPAQRPGENGVRRTSPKVMLQEFAAVSILFVDE